MSNKNEEELFQINGVSNKDMKRKDLIKAISDLIKHSNYQQQVIDEYVEMIDSGKIVVVGE